MEIGYKNLHQQKQLPSIESLLSKSYLLRFLLGSSYKVLLKLKPSIRMFKDIQ